MEEMYKNYFTAIYKFLICLTHDVDLAEDLTQETFYKAIKNISQFKNDSKIYVWLCSIAKNLYYDHCRKNNKYITLNIDDILNIEASEFTNDILAKQILSENMQILSVNNISKNFMFYFVLRFVINKHSRAVSWAGWSLRNQLFW